MILQDGIKYIAVTDKRVLCAKGWKLKSMLKDCQVKLFVKPHAIEQFFENTSNYVKPKYKVQKVKIKIEVLEDVISEELED